MMIKPNPSCNDTFCIKRQGEFQNKIVEILESVDKDVHENEIIHEDNQWGQFYTYI